MMQIKIEIDGVLIHFVNVVNIGEGFVSDDKLRSYEVSLNGEEREAREVGHKLCDGVLRLAEIALGTLT